MKKFMLFASLAMAAAAFAVPSSASAIWTNGGAHVGAGTNPQIHGEGTAQFVSPIGGVHCGQVTATMQLTGGTTGGHVQQYTPTLSSCKGTGALAGCTVNPFTIDKIPWKIDATLIHIQVTGPIITIHLGGFLCPQTLQLHTTAQHSVILQSVNTAGTGNRQAITALHLGGQTLITETNSTATLSGSFSATAADSHKYGWT